MKRVTSRLMIGLPLLASACVGSSYTAFFTNDNLGINADSGPSPQLSVAYDREEGVIAPTFEGGRTPAVLASASHNASSILPLSWAHGSVFAGGAAAVYATGTPGPAAGAPLDPRTGAACVTMRPRGWDGNYLPEAGESRPVVISTATSTGFRISLPAGAAATTASFPDVHLGYKRKEIALAPLIGTPGGCQPVAGDPGTYRIGNPSFLAVSQGGAGTGNAGGTQPNGTQLQGGNFNTGSLFATGTAADNAALMAAVQSSVSGAIAAKVAAAVPTANGPDQNSNCLYDYYVRLTPTLRDKLFSEAATDATSENLPIPPAFDVVDTDPRYAPTRAALVAAHKTDLASIPSCKQ